MRYKPLFVGVFASSPGAREDFSDSYSGLVIQVFQIGDGFESGLLFCPISTLGSLLMLSFAMIRIILGGHGFKTWEHPRSRPVVARILFAVARDTRLRWIRS